MFTLKTPAKINWFLSVLWKREDGYHEILSLMQGISLFDELTFEHSDKLDVITESEIPLEDNLVYKAALLLKEKFDVRAGAKITLRKQIPLAAGLGGGSSDAACALKGLNRLWDLGKSDDALMKTGEIIGSDIPFFFKGPFALIEGRGEKVTSLKAERRHILLLVKPSLSVSAQWAYSEMSKLLTKSAKSDNNIKLIRQSLNKQDFKSTVLINDLEVPVIREFKVIGDIKDRLLREGAHVSLMSGSGPTVFGLFGSREKAGRAVEAMKPHWVRVVETII